MEINSTINQNSYFLNFTEDLFFEIYKTLSFEDFITTTLVARIWKKFSDCEALWQLHSKAKWSDYVKLENITWKEHYQANFNGSFPGSLNFYLGDVLSVCNRTIYYLDPEKKSVVQEKNPHTGSINQLMIYDNQEAEIKFITCATDGFIKMWDSGMSDKCLLDQKIHDKSVTCIESSNNIFFSGSYDLSIKVWELIHPTDSNKVYSFNLLDTLKSHKEAITTLQIRKVGPSLNYIFSGSKDKTIKVWISTDKKNYKLSQTLDNHNSAITALKINSRMNCLISGSIDGKINIWKPQDNKFVCAQTLYSHTAAITSFVVDPFDPIFYSSALDGKIIGWKYSDPKWVQDSVNKSGAKFTCLRFNRSYHNVIDRNQLCSITSNGAINFWERVENIKSLKLSDFNNLT